MDGSLVGGGIALIAGARLLDVNVRAVPPQGLDPADIRWSFDREQIGKLNTRALGASDLASATSVAYPMVVALVSQPSGQRISGTLKRSVIYLESYLLATATATFIKNSADRPRPYTYVSDAQRQGEAEYDVKDDEAFQSMPSSHASSSFCGAAFAMTDQLISRPHSGWVERVGVAYAGGVLASMTSTLRVSAGKHFPSDVLAGGAIGMASGVLVPMVHLYATPAGRRAPHPSGRAWLQALGGMTAGIVTGILIVEASY
jgi:membrane-associated phospholipid phosphatase